MTDPATPSGTARTFSDQVVILFGTSVVTTGIGIATGVVLARLLGPSGKGDFYLATLFPVLIMTLIDLGLPQAFSFFAARGRTIGLVRKAVVLTIALTLPTLAVVFLLLPFLRSTILGSVGLDEIVLGLAVLPLAIHATFVTGILLGRRAVRWYAVVNNVHTLIAFALYAVVVGLLGLGVMGALWVALAVACIQVAGYFVGARRAADRTPDPARASYRDLFRYGLPFYPASLTQFLILRVDAFLLAWLLAEPSAPLGFYSMAVTMAQLVFFLPNAVAYVYFPHVASTSRDGSDRNVAMVSRVSLLLTAAVAIALIPVGTVLIQLLLPAFVDSLPAFYVLLPGVVALSVAKVLGSYVAGLGYAGRTSSVYVVALAANIVANLLLIPSLGIVGAAAASSIAYGIAALAFSFLAGRLAGVAFAALWIPNLGDVRFVVVTTLGIGRRVLRRWTGST